MTPALIMLFIPGLPSYNGDEVYYFKGVIGLPIVISFRDRWYIHFFFWNWAHWWRHHHRLDLFRFQNFQNPDPEGWIFLSNPHIHDSFFFLHTFHFWKWVFAVTLMADVPHIVITILWCLVVIMFSDFNLNDGILGILRHPIQPVYIKHVKILDFYLSHGTDKGVWDKIY